MSRFLVVGVDGGGTHTALVAVDEGGHVVARGSCGALNYNSSDLGTVRGRLAEAVDRLLVTVGARGFDLLSVGLSALNGEASQDERAAFCGGLFSLEKTILHTDVFMALIGFTLGRPGAMLVSGTGCMGVALDAGSALHTAGGYGYLVDDDAGSCYYIAMRGLSRVIAERDGGCEETTMTPFALRRFGISDIRELPRVLYAPDHAISDTAAFSQDVIRCAQSGDRVAAAVLDGALEILTGLALALVRDAGLPPGPIGLYGGLFEHHPDITETFSRRLGGALPGCSAKLPQFPPEIGAVIYGMKQTNRLTEAFLATLKEDYL